MNATSVRATLDELIRSRGEDYAYVSRLLGRNPTYVQQFIRRGVPRRLSEEDRRRLAAHFGVPERLLGAPAPLGREGGAPALPAPPAGLVRIPSYDVGASAGPGAVSEDDAVASSIFFHADFARSIASNRVEALSVIRVQGDSMLPTLSDGDEIVVDADDAAARLRDGIYVLRIDDALLVKRLSVNPATKRLSVVSDNKAYPPWPDCAPDEITVIGRVVWVGRRLN